jgi:DNA-directed RNA polymerase subunit H (RpoH/RPB5)
MCEVKIQVKDYKKQGYATQIGKMYADKFNAYSPISVEGYLGLDSDNYRDLIKKLNINTEILPESSANYFKIKLKNGDLLEIVRSSVPASAFIFVNKKNIAIINNTAELFSNSLPILAYNYYSNYISEQNKQEKQNN